MKGRAIIFLETVFSRICIYICPKISKHYALQKRFFLVCFLLSGAFTVALSAQSVNNVTCEDAVELTPKSGDCSAEIIRYFPLFIPASYLRKSACARTESPNIP